MQLYCDLLSIVSVIQASRFKMFFFFFLEVRLGCGSSTKIKTADIQRIMCATVVTLKKSIVRGKISFGRYARAGDRNKFA